MTTRSTTRLAPLFAALAAALAACDQVPSTAVTKCESAVSMGAAKTDILFVIDDSGSMSEEQAALKDNLSAFIDGLAQSGIENDFQIAVTNTSVTTFLGGATYTQGPNANVVPFPAGRLVAVDPGALTDDALKGKLLWDPAASLFVGSRILPVGSPSLTGDFKANVLVGIDGSGKEQPFRAVRLALEAAAPGGANEGFLRPGARLAVVFLTDEDDCSESRASTSYVATSDATCETAADQLDTVSDFAAFLDAPILGEERHPVVAAVSGFDLATLAPTGCTSGSGQSFRDPTRMSALLDTLGSGRTVKASICGAFDTALRSIADLVVPQTVPLDSAPQDYRMLVATVTKPDGTVVGCPVAAAGTPEAATAGAVYTPPLEGRAATVKFQGDCTLHTADRVDLNLVCAG